MTRQYRYTIRTLDGQRHLIDATDAAEAVRFSGIAPELIRKFYPFCIGEVSTEEKPKNKEGGKRLKQYRDELKESKLQLDKERACDCTESPCDKLHDRDEEIERAAEERDLLEPPAVDSTSSPQVEHLATGEVQILLPTTPARTVPAAPLRPRRAQNDKPLALETVYIAASQGRLF